MAERKSPTAVLHEGPRALTDEQVRQIETAELRRGLSSYLLTRNAASWDGWSRR